MTPRERVRTALQHRQPDRTPYHIGFTKQMHARMAEYFGDPGFLERVGNHFTVLRAEPAGARVEIRPHIWRDQFGVHWDRSVDQDIGVVLEHLVWPENLATFVLPDPDEPSRFAPYETLRRDYPDTFVVTNISFSLFERAWTLAGMETLLMAMVENPDFVHQLLDRLLQFNLRLIERICHYDIDAVMFGDDWGQQHGLIMGPHLWREFIRPRIRQMYQAVKTRGKFVFIHSCGKVQQLFPELIECGLDVFNPLQPEVMDVVEIKREFGGQLSFYGGISTQRTLPFGTVRETRDAVRRLIDVLGRDGGYIASPAHAVPPDARPENVAAMIDVLQNQ
ncbi:MAG: uroporphyrinogen decarboxylase family protein [Pirellulaceae bacterium]